MKRFSTPRSFFVSLTLVLVLPVLATAQTSVPMLVNYQGELRSPTTGEPVADGSYEMRFRIYDAESGGTLLWTGNYSSLNGNPVEVAKGIFDVILGSGEGNDLDTSIFNGADRWLEIRIGMETLSPRQKMTSVAYAIVSENSRLLGGKEASEFVGETHDHSGSDITSGVVSESRIDPLITRDSEKDAGIAAHAAVANAHHERYMDSEAVAAMGPKSAANPLNHDKTTKFSELTDIVADAQIPGSIARDSEIMPTVLANDGTGSGLDADTVDGTDSAALEESAEIDSDIATHAAIADAHHSRYTDAEAVTAMGAKADSNPLNHDKTTSLPWGSITAVPAGFADNVDNDTIYSAGDGLDLTGTVFSAEFGGSGSATSVSHSDHHHDASYVNEGQLDSVTSAMISDGTIADGDVNAAAAVSGTKISPNFGSQNIVTSGRIGIGTSSPAAALVVTAQNQAYSVQLDQGNVITDNAAASTSRYVVSIGGTWYWGVGKANAFNNDFHIINYPSSRWDFTVRNDTGRVGVGTTSPQEKLDVNGNARVAGDLTVVGTATLGGVTMGKIYLTGSGTILSTDGGTRVLYWDKGNSEIELTNTSGDYLDYWWQAQKGTTTSGDATSLATGNSNVAIISGIGTTNCYGCEVHFGQADDQEGWCSVWLQYANDKLVGHYVKY